MSKLPNQEGSIDEILNSMIELLGKDKICEHSNSMIMSFNDIDNPAAVKSIKLKIQKTISRHKDTIFEIRPVLYTFKQL